VAAVENVNWMLTKSRREERVTRQDDDSCKSINKDVERRASVHEGLLCTVQPSCEELHGTFSVVRHTCSCIHVPAD
jgi:hypothetical protein